MKKALIACTLAGLILSCGGGYNSSSDKGFTIQPGDLTQFTLQNKSHSITFGGTPYNCVSDPGCYAILFQGTINGTQYVGLAVQRETLTEIFNLKIYYPGSIPTTFPDSKDIQADSNSVVKVERKNISTGVTTTYTYDHIAAFTINFTAAATNNVYPITATGTPSVGGSSLTITSIDALGI
ncbi:MAG: hypothetical protein EPN93_20800 [Spirochaetes bacterium]|nr:MAG: hypothetical protein EPN93_20800 [Spirochaetota bacterium]